MLSALQHRGPDAEGFLKLPFGKSTLFIGSNRLKINDLRDEANQPMGSEDGKYILSFNGEIYNHIALRQLLPKKYNFLTHSDTETLLYHLIEKAETGIEELNGMFGFAFADLTTQKITVTRDRFGMKPLYYFENQQYVIVSSEIKGILASGLVSKKLNSSQISHYLRYRFADAPQTFFQDIYEVEPHTVYTFSDKGFVQKASCISSENAMPPDTDLETILLQSVASHLKADVPVGLFLSGGVDSTLLLALANELGFKNLPAFTIGNQQLTQDENFARKAARQYGVELFEIETDSSLLLNFDDFVQKIDQPIADSAAWLTYLLSQKASQQGVKAVISGAGADEFFGGYHRHQAFQFYLKHAKLLTQNKNLLSKIAGLLPARFRQIQKFLSQLDNNPQQTFLNFTALTTPSVIQENLFTNYLSEWNSLKSLLGDLEAALRFDQKYYLTQDILKMTDQMAMQAGIEVRLPYLDMNVNRLSQSLSGEYLLKNGKKWLLKDILKNKGGNIYITRKKEGLGFPFGKWLFSETGKELLQSLLQPHNFIYQLIDYKIINQLITLQKSGKADYTSELWAIFLLKKWLDKEFGTDFVC